MVRVPRGLFQLEQPPGIVHQVLLMLRVHGVHLPVLAALVKQRAEEELGKPTGAWNMACKLTHWHTNLNLSEILVFW